eukprot:TRINITY_DN16265_c0_g1_i1.p1 TRINITY_DN16265_c0_g1~~TRINITY_DN16265_c0_g1_i1.p1  ORF type:complete len:502 (+),score=21.91 TRINITY_DN16265_c0_g1_i1:97-1602(+)
MPSLVGSEMCIRDRYMGSDCASDPKPLKAYLCLAGSCLMGLVAGTTYLWGGLTPYLISYYTLHNEMSLNLFSILLICASFCLQFFSINTLPVANLIGFRALCVVCVLLISSHFLVSSMVENVYLFCVSYCILFASGAGFANIAVCYPSWAWFPTAKGRITGLIMAFYAMSSFPFMMIAENVMNPQNADPVRKVQDGHDIVKLFDAKVAARLPSTLATLGLVIAVVGLIGCTLISMPDSNVDEEKKGLASGVASKENEERERRVDIDLTQTQFWIKKEFWYIFFLQFSTTMPVYYLAFNYKSYGFHRFDDDYFITFVGSFGMLVNGMTRPFYGLLFDKIGYKRTTFLILPCQMVFLFTLYFVRTKVLFAAWIWVMFSTEGGLFVIHTSQALRVFGLNYGSRIIPFVSLSSQLSMINFFIINSMVLPSLGLEITFVVIMPLIQLLALMLLFSYNEKNKANFDATTSQKEKQDTQGKPQVELNNSLNQSNKYWNTLSPLSLIHI